MKELPTREAVIAVIEQLRRGEVDRNYVAQWAFAIIDEPGRVISDELLWDAIQCLGAADLIATDRDYLYANADFEDWLNSLKP